MFLRRRGAAGETETENERRDVEEARTKELEILAGHLRLCDLGLNIDTREEYMAV